MTAALAWIGFAAVTWAVMWLLSDVPMLILGISVAIYLWMIHDEDKHPAETVGSGLVELTKYLAGAALFAWILTSV